MDTQLDASIWRIPQTVDYICQRGFKIVTLQFPDDQLPQSAQIAQLLQTQCASRAHSIKAYILADTTYNPLSVDEVAAAHVDAQCIIHYGRASLTALSRIPAYFVFPHHPLSNNNDIHSPIDTIIQSILRLDTDNNNVVVFIDQIHTDTVPEIKAYFQSRMDQLKEEGGGKQRIIIADPVGNTLDPPSSSSSSSGCACSRMDIEDRKMVAGYTWTPPSDDDNNNNNNNNNKMVMVWIGSMDAPALYQLQITYNTADWLVYDTMNDRLYGGINEEGEEPSRSSSYLIDEVTKTLRRRYFLVEKARNANIIGIVMGTLGVAGYRQVLTVLKKAVAKAGKKSYTFLMGKPSPAKLANFPEVDVFVLVADPQGQIMDCKEYLAPIITPHEAMIAFTRKEWDAASYRLDFQDLLIQAKDDDTGSDTANVQPGPRFSLIDGSHHIDNEEEEEDRSNDDIQGNALAVHAQRALQVTATVKGGGDMMRIVPTSAAEYMVHKRTWKGVDAPVLTGAEEKEVVGAVEGRSGRARGYADEKGGGK